MTDRDILIKILFDLQEFRALTLADNLKIEKIIKDIQDHIVRHENWLMTLEECRQFADEMKGYKNES